MTTEEALVSLAESTAEAVAGVLRMYVPDAVDVGGVTVAIGSEPLKTFPLPCVAASVTYSDGATGGNVFAITMKGARLLAAAMMGMEPEPDEGELSELELSAVSEATNQMMAAAAAATSRVLGHGIEISTPDSRNFTLPGEAEKAFEATPHSTAVPFSLLGEPCKLVQLVPNAFIVRMTRALQDREAVFIGPSSDMNAGVLAPDSVRSIPVRVWAELGRTRMPVARAVGLPSGAVVELDHGADEPVDLLVNGKRFATGRLLLGTDDEWAVRIEQVLPFPELYAGETPGGR